MRLNGKNYNISQQQQTFGAIQGKNFDKGFSDLLINHFGLKKARKILIDSHTMNEFSDFFAGIKVAVAHSDKEAINWVDPIIDIEKKDADTFTIHTRLADSINSTADDLNIKSLNDNPDCLYQILDAIQTSSSKLNQANGHIITSIEEKSELSFEHSIGENPFDKNFILPPLPQTEENIVAELTPIPLQEAC